MAELFDLAHFKMMTGGDRTVQTEVVALFCEQAGKSASVLRPEAPAQQCREVAHTLKGSARGLGLWRLAEACAQAESLAGGESAAPAFDAVRGELLAAVAALEQAMASGA